VAFYNIRLDGWLILNINYDHTSPPYWSATTTATSLWFGAYRDFKVHYEEIKVQLRTSDYSTEDLEYDLNNKNILLVPVDTDLLNHSTFYPDFNNSIVIT